MLVIHRAHNGDRHLGVNTNVYMLASIYYAARRLFVVAIWMSGSAIINPTRVCPSQSQVMENKQDVARAN